LPLRAVVGFSKLILETRQAAGVVRYLLLTLASNVVVCRIERRYRTFANDPY
jgi:hypothetical protein